MNFVIAVRLYYFKRITIYYRFIVLLFWNSAYRSLSKIEAVLLSLLLCFFLKLVNRCVVTIRLQFVNRFVIQKSLNDPGILIKGP